jgi:fumarate hydratase class II
MGATAIGSELNVPKGYPKACADELAKLLNKPIVPATDMFAATWDQQGFVAYSNALESLAIKLSKISGDLILLDSGPRAGLGEIDLPAVQPGSSIMPGKVNPVIVESLTMVVARVVGNDATVAFGQTGSLLELNVMLPVTAVALLESITLLAAASRNFAERCVSGITATDRGPALVEQGLMLATALAPVIGYDAAAKLAKDAFASGRTIRELALERGMDPAELDQLLDPASMTEPGLSGGPAGGG